MNKEVKEILDFKENADYKKLSCDEIAILRDYITNLHQENERLKDQNINEILKKDLEICTKQYKKSDEKIKKLEKRNKEIYEGFLATQEEMSDYATRIDKAIEYIEGSYFLDFSEIIDILRGDK